MTLKHPSTDYEPLRRTPASASSVEDTAGDSFHFKKPETRLNVGEVTAASARVQREGKPEEKSELAPAREKWIHKHGHTVSYAGIFLFTALVFFRPYELIPSLSWTSKVTFWVALATIAIYVITQLGLENTITARPREVNLVLLLLVTGILSVPLALDPGLAFERFIEFLKVVLIFIVMINVVRTEKRLTKLWILVLLAACILSFNAVNDYRLGLLELQGVRIKGTIGGLFDNPNDLALHLVTMLPLAVALFINLRNPLTRILFLFTALIIVGAIVVTFSRAGFLAFLAAGGVFLWKLARRSRWMIPVVAAPLVLSFVLLAPGGYRTRLATTGDESSMARFDDLKRSLFIAARHPVFGVGMDNYILFSNSNKASHNSYTQVASEMGVVAAVLYILFILTPFKGLRRIERQSYEVKSARRFYYASIALQASIAGFMVASFFASVAYLWYIYYLVAYAVCLRRIYDSTVEQDVAAALSNRT